MIRRTYLVVPVVLLSLLVMGAAFNACAGSGAPAEQPATRFRCELEARIWAGFAAGYAANYSDPFYNSPRADELLRQWRLRGGKCE